MPVEQNGAVSWKLNCLVCYKKTLISHIYDLWWRPYLPKMTHESPCGQFVRSVITWHYTLQQDNAAVCWRVFVWKYYIVSVESRQHSSVHHHQICRLPLLHQCLDFTTLSCCDITAGQCVKVVIWSSCALASIMAAFNLSTQCFK